MKKISAYKTSDGQVFEVERDAMIHEAELNVHKVLLSILEKESISLGGYHSTHEENVKDIAEALKKHSITFGIALNAYNNAGTL